MGMDNHSEIEWERVRVTAERWYRKETRAMNEDSFIIPGYILG